MQFFFFPVPVPRVPTLPRVSPSVSVPPDPHAGLKTRRHQRLPPAFFNLQLTTYNLQQHKKKQQAYPPRPDRQLRTTQTRHGLIINYYLFITAESQNACHNPQQTGVHIKLARPTMGDSFVKGKICVVTGGSSCSIGSVV